MSRSTAGPDPRLRGTMPRAAASAPTTILAVVVVVVVVVGTVGQAATAHAQQPPPYEGQEQVEPGYANGEAWDQPPDMPGYGPPSAATDGQGDPSGAAYAQQNPENTALIPPNIEGEPYAAEGGGYCYVGPHPVDVRYQPGVTWDPTEGQHIRPYPPVDTRLFALSDGCYYFTGDPRDFGYGGPTYAYYGAHPILPAYGGGWCFMMGGHAHLWRPWSPYFTVVGPWNYWQGAYDPFFWAYWPYYSFFYRSYYPHYYGGGRFYRGGGFRVAPPIRSVPPSAWRGATPGRVAPAVRGAAPTQTQMYRPGVPSSGGAIRGNGWGRGAAPAITPAPSFVPRPGGTGARGGFHGGGRR